MSMTIQEAIKRINEHMSIHHIGQYPHIHLAEAMQMALDALREKAEREDPRPLTLEEALSAEAPIWIQKIDGTNGRYDDWGAVQEGYQPGTVNRLWIGTDEEDWLYASDYGKTWLAYRNKPKEVK